MKFLKTLIVLVFLLSLACAGVTFYLSTIRENEKEKRIYLESVRAELEGQVEKLEGEKIELQDQANNLEAKNQDLAKQLEEEKEARKRAIALVQEKDSDLESLRGEMGDAQRAFENAQKRNQELERILDELESRMRQVEEQKALSAPDANASGFVELSVTPVNPSAGTPTTFAESTDRLSSTQDVIEKPASSAVTPVTTLPQPPKRRKFFPFFRKSEEPAPQPARAETESIAPASGEFLIPKEPQGTTISQVSEVSVGKPETSKPAVETPRRTDQTIAGGNVLLVNRNYNFIVINLGSKQGISLDDILSVQHEGVEIAKVRVEKLYDDYSAAYIVEEQSQHPIGEGDGVTAA